MLPAFRANSLCWRSKVVKRPRVIPGAFAWNGQSGDYQSVVGGPASLRRRRRESQSGRRRRSHQTTNRRRWRRIIANSYDRTRRPSGIIQKPRIGRKPRSPPRVSSMPIAIRQPRERGMVNSRPKIEIFRAGALLSSAAVIQNQIPSAANAMSKANRPLCSVRCEALHMCARRNDATYSRIKNWRKIANCFFAKAKGVCYRLRHSRQSLRSPVAQW